MSVINATEFALKRARVELERAHNKKDWEALKHWDKQLGEFLNLAFNDENRDTRALISELEVILATYNRVVLGMSSVKKNFQHIPDN